jgi:hypothetical protein
MVMAVPFLGVLVWVRPAVAVRAPGRAGADAVPGVQRGGARPAVVMAQPKDVAARGAGQRTGDLYGFFA